MRIAQNEIASISLLGILDGQEIQLVRTKGGLNLAVGRNHKGVETVLSAASHPAILSYNMEKNHSGFCSALLKSERENSGIIDKHSHFLSEDLRKSGYDIYSGQVDNAIVFWITQHNLSIASANGEIQKDELVLSSFESKLNSFKDPLAKAVSEKALSCGINKVKIG